MVREHKGIGPLLAKLHFYHFWEGHPQNLSSKSKVFISDPCDLLFKTDRLSISKEK